MTKLRRILICTPLKGDIPSTYFKTSLQLATASIPGIKFDWTLLEGPAVQMARNELVAHAREQKFDEIIFWDKDVTAEMDGDNVTASAIMRLVSHDKDFVCAPYSARSLSTHWHLQPIAGEKPAEDGLQKVSRACIGFSKIKLSVFDRIEVRNPWRKAVLIDPNKAPKPVTEFFPMGVQGKNTPEYRLKQIEGLLKEDFKSHEALVQRIQREVDIKYDEPNLFAGEDYWFCDLAREAGIDIYLDTMLIMGHLGQTVMPVPTPKLIAALNEPWRQEEIREIKAQLAKHKAQP
jgi:hypothetical protein